MPIRAYYGEPVHNFLKRDDDYLLGILTREHHHSIEEPQRWAWLEQLSVLRAALSPRPTGTLFLEFYIPRMGKRADAVLVSDCIVFVIEFKIGATGLLSSGLEQVQDYALDLKNFHQGSHSVPIIPILVPTKTDTFQNPTLQFADDLVASPLATNAAGLGPLIEYSCTTRPFPPIDVESWIAAGYKPTPTIVQAAEVLYRTHQVRDIAQSEAKNLGQTIDSVSQIIDRARAHRKKTLCFVTGVPGSGKTLAGLEIATRRSEERPDEHTVFLSGNGPLVTVLTEALARDKVRRDRVSKKDAKREVRSFIQNIHHFRDHYVATNEVPVEKVVVFDEAQRAWTREQAASFMQRKRGQPDFDMSEPEFLISILDRHPDWCTIVCLVGGGQEINTGEGGISEWISALQTRFSGWDVYVPLRILLPEYGSERKAKQFLESPRVHSDEDLHLAVCMRSFRAEVLSDVIGHVIDNRPEAARVAYKSIEAMYPIYLTRDLSAARKWLRSKARGTERFGLMASSGAQRLRPEGIHIKAPIEAENWFLNGKTDVRSSYYLEDVATEFAVQGLELDWACVCWDADLHHRDGEWAFQSFKGTKWQSIRDEIRRTYLKNAYRVILTRSRQGMVLFVPNGDRSDATRPPTFYDPTFEYLHSCGFPLLETVASEF